jgi:beta-glucosidase
MNGRNFRSSAITVVAIGAVAGAQFWFATLAVAQGDRPRYLDTALPAETRAVDLVGRMTLEEKASQMVNQSRAITRLDVPAYDWWNEALHGVVTDGITEFPEPVGLAATFDPAVIHRMSHAIGIEARIKHAQAVKEGHSNMHEGLDFWAPNVNIFRDPRWGRGQETYGEDPFLSGRMAVAFVTGLQGDDPRYYLAISTPKHFAVHSGPEPSRHRDDVAVSKHDELDTYLPAFRAAVTEGKAGSVMCAYNSINGEPACANQFLLQDQLRGKWGFQGYVVSDCDAVGNVTRDHHYVKTLPEAAAIVVERGMDNECNSYQKNTDDHDYRQYYDAVKQGFLKESEMDRSLVRLFAARIRMGMFDPPQMVPYTKIDEKELDSAERVGAQDRERVDGSAQERRRAANREAGQEDSCRGATGRTDQGAARQLQRSSLALGFDPRRNVRRVRQGQRDLQAWNNLSGATHRASSRGGFHSGRAGRLARDLQVRARARSRRQAARAHRC